MIDESKLQALIDAGDDAGCVAFFQGMNEADRRAWAGMAERTLRQASKTPIIQSGQSFSSNPAIGAAAVAVSASCSFSVIKQFNDRAIPFVDHLVPAMIDRRPPWIDDYAEFLLDRDFPNWEAVRRLMKAGLCRKPKHDNYVIALTNRHTFYNRTSRNFDVLGGLLAEPDLLDEVWRLFELEGGGEFSLSAHDKYMKASGPQRWDYSLVELSRRGVLPRERLLDVSLAALDRGFAQFRAGWFSAFHELLTPTIDERTARAPQYLRLLASPIPPTVSFALAAMIQIDRAAALPSQTLIEGLSPVLSSRAKTTVKSALKLLANIAERDQSARQSVCLTASEALLHEAADVQGAALTLIERSSSAGDEACRAAVSRFRQSIAASLRDRYDRWLGAAPHAASEDGSRAASATGDLKALTATIHRLPQRWVELAEVKPAIDAAVSIAERAGAGRHRPGASDPPALCLSSLTFDGTEIPRLDAEAAIVPIETLDELIDAAAAAIENPDDYDACERVMDGVARCCDQRPDDFERRTGPLRKRCRQLLKRVDTIPFRGYDPAVHLLGLLLAWLSGDAGEFRTRREERYNYTELAIDGMTPAVYSGHLRPHAVSALLGARALALAQRATERRAGPLLSAPTHAGGWIAPLALAERVSQIENPDAACELDQALALLRLAPDDRPAALKRLMKLSGPFVEAFRYACGGSSRPSAEPAWLCIAAARARSPWTDAEISVRSPEKAGPDAWLSPQTEVASYKSYNAIRLKVDVRPALPDVPDNRLPTVALWSPDGREYENYHSVAEIRALHSVWPMALDGACRQGLAVLAGNIDWWTASWNDRMFLEPLVDADVPMRPLATLMVAVGLGCKNSGERCLATDICLAAIGDGRLDGDRLGSALGVLFPAGIITISRWASALGQVAAASELHAEIVRRAIEASLAGDVAQAPRDLHAYLALLWELVCVTETPVASPARTYLSQLSGSGKQGKLAGQILSFTGQPTAERLAKVSRQVVQSRIERAQRWAKRCTLR